MIEIIPNWHPILVHFTVGLLAGPGWPAYNSFDHDDVSHAAMTTHRNWALPTVGLFVVLALWSVWRHVARPGSLAPLINAAFLATLVAGGVLLGSTAWH